MEFSKGLQTFLFLVDNVKDLDKLLSNPQRDETEERAVDSFFTFYRGSMNFNQPEKWFVK